MNASSKRVANTAGKYARLVGLGCLFGVLLAIMPAVGSIVFHLTPVSFDTPGLAQEHFEAAQVASAQAEADALAAEAEAAQVASLTEGMTCWDPSTGRLPSHVVVRDAGTDVVSVLPFTSETYDRAVAGEFVTLSACEVA